MVGPKVTRTYGSAFPNMPFFSSFLAPWTRRWRTPAENCAEDREEERDRSGELVRSTECRDTCDPLQQHA